MEFATKKESYSDVIERLLESARKRLIQDILMSSENTITIEEALKKAKKRWQK